MDYYAVYGAEFLKHHGILGQKWGKVNGPPYPLGSDQHSTLEKKDNWRKSLNGANNKKIYERHRSVERKKERRLNAEQKEKIKKAAIIGAAVVGTALVAYGGYKLYQNKDMLRMKANLGKKNLDFIRNSGKFDYLDTAFDDNSISESVKESVNEFRNDGPLADTWVNNLDRARDEIKGYIDPEDVRKLTDDEIRALQGYTTPKYYKQINQVADGLAEGYDEGYFAGFDPIARTMSKDIMSAMDKVTLQKDAQLQRGIKDTACRNILGNELFGNLENIRNQCNRNDAYNGEIIKVDNLKNFIIPSRGFTSTAIPFEMPMLKKDKSGFVLNSDGSRKRKLNSVADYFSGKEGIIFDIKAKSGMHAIDISSISELSAEREILFGVNSDIIANGDIAIIDGIIHVYGELVQR